MTRVIILAAFLSSVVHAQEVPPPPRPPDEGPSLEVTMKFIEDKLNGQGKVNYVLTRHDSRTNRVQDLGSISNTLSEANAKAEPCTLSFSSIYLSTADRVERRIDLSLREAEKLAVSPAADVSNRRLAEAGHPEVTEETAPAIFILTVQMLQGKSVRVRSQSALSTEESANGERRQKSVDLIFRDEELAQRMAKAMVHAIEVCGGGNKDPF